MGFQKHGFKITFIFVFKLHSEMDANIICSHSKQQMGSKTYRIEQLNIKTQTFC